MSPGKREKNFLTSSAGFLSLEACWGSESFVKNPRKKEFKVLWNIVLDLVESVVSEIFSSLNVPVIPWHEGGTEVLSSLQEFCLAHPTRGD